MGLFECVHWASVSSQISSRCSNFLTPSFISIQLFCGESNVHVRDACIYKSAAILGWRRGTGKLSFPFYCKQDNFFGDYFVFMFVLENKPVVCAVHQPSGFEGSTWKSNLMKIVAAVSTFWLQDVSLIEEPQSVWVCARPLRNIWPHFHHFVMNLAKGKQTSSQLISADPPSWSSAEQNSRARVLPAARLRLWVDGYIVIYPARRKCHQQRLAL